MKKLKVGSDFSGVGAFDQALKRLGVDYETLFACDMDKYARKTYILNYGEPKYYPENVYEREIPVEPLDIYMTSPPCQAFSLAGKRKGEEDKRGVLFYNSHEFIKKNKPKAFIFENVKGLLSDDKGKTFQRWIDLLGGKSINGNPVIFPHEESVPYNIYYKVINAKDYGVPQNRERIFIIGIREYKEFNFPKPFELVKRLRDILETFETSDFNTEEEFNAYMKKYFLSDEAVDGFIQYSDSNKFLKVNSANSKGYEIAEIGEDSINFEHPNSETRRGRVGKGVAQTLTTSCNQGVVIQINECKESGGKQPYQQNRVYDIDGVSPALCAFKSDLNIKISGTLQGKHEQNSRVYNPDGISPTLTTMQGGGQEPKIMIGAIRGRYPDNPKSRKSGLPTEQMLEINESDMSNTLTTVQKDNVVVYLEPEYRIRKLTPLEAFRLMDFLDSLVENARKGGISDSQLYKQAGNSICVEPLKLLIENILKL